MSDRRSHVRSLPALHNRSYRVQRFSPLIFVAAVGLAGLWACTHIADQAAPVPRCPNSAQARVSAVKPTVTVTYIEPTLDRAGGQLKDLAKTTIYYDVGNGRIPIKEVPASKPTGGQEISQTISLPIQSGQETLVRICVTATNHRGEESETTP